jgi:hypothetical protein
MAQQLTAAGKYFEVDASLQTNAQAKANELLAVALRLFDDPCPLEYDVNRVNLMVAQIEQAGTRSDLPAGIGLTRFKPRGFYTRSSALMRYFRAVNLLQVTSFALNDDEQLLSLAILARASQLQDETSQTPCYSLRRPIRRSTVAHFLMAWNSARHWAPSLRKNHCELQTGPH